ncbi:Hypothetical predicted protein [Pelobates cultripes]|uniref:Uncharacterized protein n=1 Tax=Pelobates cultripes TaxID=61616 RepID=A0AAD1S2R7_PELCU|nr:Hypothetical predicted protein [Pelobates cultripes]
MHNFQVSLRFQTVLSCCLTVAASMHRLILGAAAILGCSTRSLSGLFTSLFAQRDLRLPGGVRDNPPGPQGGGERGPLPACGRTRRTKRGRSAISPARASRRAAIPSAQQSALPVGYGPTAAPSVVAQVPSAFS